MIQAKDLILCLAYTRSMLLLQGKADHLSETAKFSSRDALENDRSDRYDTAIRHTTARRAHLRASAAYRDAADRSDGCLKELLMEKQGKHKYIADHHGQEFLRRTSIDSNEFSRLALKVFALKQSTIADRACSRRWFNRVITCLLYPYTNTKDLHAEALAIHLRAAAVFYFDH